MTVTTDPIAPPEPTGLSATAPIEQRPRFGTATPGVPPAMVFDDEPDATSSRPWRRWLLIAIAALVILFVGAVLGRVTSPTSGADVLVLTHAVAPGTTVTSADVRVTKMSNAPTGHLAGLGGLTGKVARVALQPGQVVTTSMVTGAGTLPTTAAVTVGVAVTAGHGPAQPLEVGDTVAVVNVPPNNGNKPLPPRTLVGAATVVAVAVDHSGNENVSVNVPAAQSVAVAASASAGQATLILVK